MTKRFKITINGTDFTDRLPNMPSISLNDNRAFKADTVTLTLNNSSGVDLPEKGALLKLDLSDNNGTWYDKGEYIVDGFSVSGPPDIITIIARSANIKESLNQQKTKSYQDKTLGDILNYVAGNQKLTLKINPELANIPIEHIDQTNESDGHFICRLGVMFGAVATIKSGHLVFMPLSRGVTPTGTPLAAVAITKGDCVSYSYDQSQRKTEFSAVRAKYHDLDSAKKLRIEIATGNTGEKIKTLSAIYKNETLARAAANAEISKLSDIGTYMDITLSNPRPDIIPETPVSLSGFMSTIDNKQWVADTVKHTINQGAFKTQLKIVLKN